jgi:SAM-dependent methyltransferase
MFYPEPGVKGDQVIGGVERVRDAYDLKYTWALGHRRRLSIWEDATLGEGVLVEVGPGIDTEHWSDYLKRRLGVDSSYFRDKLVLDVGCGLGWATFGASKLGAATIGIDVSRTAAKFSHELVKAFEAHIVLCDVRFLPFKRGIFDLAMTWGLLHHTPNTRKSFLEVAKHVKKGGELFVYLYEWHNPYRLVLINLLRKLVQLFSIEGQHTLVKKLVEIQDFQNHRSFFRKLYSNPVARYFIIFASDPFALLDFLSPQYNHVHRASEVLAWYRESDFTTAHILNPALSYKVPFGGFLWGKHGGGLYVAGSR